MIKKRKVLIIGAGASGLMAAITAGRNGAEVILLEQMQRVGKKILATGNGRCNLSNVFTKTDRYHGQNNNFVDPAFKKLGAQDTLNFFEEIGISVREEEGGKVYPWSGQASSVLDVLRYELQKLGIEEKCESEVKKLIHNKSGFVVILKDGSEIKGDSVVLATGGRSNSNLGSTGSGYKLALELGHKMIETFPALVQLKLDFHHLKALSGVKFIGSAAVVSKGNVARRENGEILFTDYGISGPPILQLSRRAAELLNKGAKAYLSVDMFIEFSKEEIMGLIKRKIKHDPLKPVDFCFIGLLHKKLIPVILKSCGISDIHMPCGELSEEEIIRITELLKEWTFEITGTKSWQDAQVTAGGIDTRDINPVTMESRLVKGLFFSGEIMDIDGDCGGFNLQWAWSSGYMAGLNAALI